MYWTLRISNICVLHIFNSCFLIQTNKACGRNVLPKTYCLSASFYFPGAYSLPDAYCLWADISAKFGFIPFFFLLLFIFLFCVNDAYSAVLLEESARLNYSWHWFLFYYGNAALKPEYYNSESLRRKCRIFVCFTWNIDYYLFTRLKYEVVLVLDLFDCIVVLFLLRGHRLFLLLSFVFFCFNLWI